MVELCANVEHSGISARPGPELAAKAEVKNRGVVVVKNGDPGPVEDESSRFIVSNVEVESCRLFLCEKYEAAAWSGGRSGVKGVDEESGGGEEEEI